MPEKQKKIFEWWWLVLPIVYLLFFTFGFPNNLIGSTWPTLNNELGFSLGGVSTVFMIISIGNIIASFTSDKIIRSLGHAKVVALGLILTIIAVIGWAFSTSFIVFCCFALPFGFGAGWGVAATNNYMVDHYRAFHLSMVNCVWAGGAAVGGLVIKKANSYVSAFISIAIVVAVVLVILLINARRWKQVPPIEVEEEHKQKEEEANSKPITMKDAIVVPGVIAAMFALFLYASIENVNNTNATNYLFNVLGAPEKNSAGMVFFIGLAAGRFVTAFATLKLSDRTLARIGEAIMLVGSIFMLAASHSVTATLIAIAIVGVGCAPINPMIVHSAPDNFGRKYSQAAIGLILTMSNIGNLLMPKLFNLVADHTSIGYKFYPIYVLILCILLAIVFEVLQVRSRKNKTQAA